MTKRHKMVCMTLLMMVMMLISSSSLSVNALTAAPVTGSIMGYSYRGTFELTSTKTTATFSGDAEISNESVPDEPRVELEGGIFNTQGDMISYPRAYGIKYCKYSMTFSGAVEGFCEFEIDYVYVGRRDIEL